MKTRGTKSTINLLISQLEHALLKLGEPETYLPSFAWVSENIAHKFPYLSFCIYTCSCFIFDLVTTPKIPVYSHIKDSDSIS